MHYKRRVAASAAIKAEPAQRPRLVIVETVDDLILFGRWVEGDPEAGGELVERHGRALLRWITSKAGASEAEDLYADTWIAALTAGGYQGAGSFEGWLFSVARTQMSRRWRRQERDGKVLAGLRDDRSRTSPSRHVLRLEAAAAFEDISHEQIRETARMRLIEGMTETEVAAATGASPSTVRTRVWRAAERLRERFGR